MQKYERGGYVAILVASGLCGTWSTGTNDRQTAEAMLFCVDLVLDVLGNVSTEELITKARRLFPDCEAHSILGCEVIWVEKGATFTVVKDYPSRSEKLVVFDDRNIFTA